MITSSWLHHHHSGQAVSNCVSNCPSRTLTKVHIYHGLVFNSLAMFTDVKFLWDHSLSVSATRRPPSSYLNTLIWTRTECSRIDLHQVGTDNYSRTILWLLCKILWDLIPHPLSISDDYDFVLGPWRLENSFMIGCYNSSDESSLLLRFFYRNKRNI